MQVRVILEHDGPNPLFDPKEKIQVEAVGGVYPHHHSVKIPVGTIIDHPKSHYLCRPQFGNGPPLCEPYDDAAKVRHARYLYEAETAKERLRIDALRANPNTANGKFMIDLAKAYGVWDGPEDEEPGDDDEEET